MPTLKVARSKTSTLRADFDSVWAVLDGGNVSCQGQGLYWYVGKGGSDRGDVGLIKTKFPLDPTRMGGIASFEINLTETGE